MSGESVDHGIWGHKTCPLLRRGREEGRRQGCRGGGGCFPLTGGRLRGRAVWQPAGAGDSGYFPSRLRRAGKFRNDDVVFLRIAPVSGESVDHGIWGHKTCPLLRRGREEGRRQGCRGVGGGVFRSREGGCGGGRCGSPLAREIPDISRHGFAASENSGMTVLFF